MRTSLTVVGVMLMSAGCAWAGVYTGTVGGATVQAGTVGGATVEPAKTGEASTWHGPIITATVVTTPTQDASVQTTPADAGTTTKQGIDAGTVDRETGQKPVATGDGVVKAKSRADSIDTSAAIDPFQTNNRQLPTALPAPTPVPAQPVTP